MTAVSAATPRPGIRALTVQGWVRLVFAVITILAVAGAVIIGELLAHGRAVTDELADSVLPAQAQAYRLQGALLDQETGVRGYGITGRLQFLRPYSAGVSIEAGSAARLRTLAAGSPSLTADLNLIEQAARQWRRDFAVPLIARARNGPLGPHDLGLLVQSKDAFDHLRALFRAQNARLVVAAAQDQARIDRIRSIQNWVFVAILGVLLVASGVLAVAVHQAVVRPLSQLRAASRQVADGDFDHRITPAGPADVQAVAADVEGMRRELASALNEARIASQIAADRAAELDQYAAELRRSNAELEQFAYVASHDLQEPLRKVASFCQLLAQRYDDKLDERGRQYIEYAVDGAKRLQVLINELLTFSRVGRSDAVHTRLPMGQALDAAIGALGVTISESGTVIERPDQLPDVLGDPTLLLLVWQNLLGNAIKFREPGRPPVVRIAVTEQPAGQWLFSVMDNGIGIAPEFADKVFVIFQRLHSREAYPGTGIGLALCRRIIEHHGGEVSLDTSYTGGTRITFTMPSLDSMPETDAVEGTT